MVVSDWSHPEAEEEGHHVPGVPVRDVEDDDRGEAQGGEEQPGQADQATHHQPGAHPGHLKHLIIL